MEMGRGCTQDGAGSLIFQMARCLAIQKLIFPNRLYWGSEDPTAKNPLTTNFMH